MQRSCGYRLKLQQLLKTTTKHQTALTAEDAEDAEEGHEQDNVRR